MTILPAATSVSLLAMARFFFAAIARRVGTSPAKPIIELSTVSASLSSQRAVAPSFPERTRQEVSARAIFNPFAASSSATAQSGTRKRRICSSKSAVFLCAESARTESPRCAATSSACVPIEPVEPKMQRDFVSIEAFLSKMPKKRHIRLERNPEKGLLSKRKIIKFG